MSDKAWKVLERQGMKEWGHPTQKSGRRLVILFENRPVSNLLEPYF